jgi:tRNA pseudouridine55 synthase
VNASSGDYLLPVDKPEGPTSHDIVAAARRALRTRRIGHTGTLDPFASGLLVLCVGRATRLAEYLSELDKSYVAVATLGVRTDTLDLHGDVVSQTEAWREVDEAAIAHALGDLRGQIEQVPPQFSAKKVAGEAMHRRARRGERVDLPAVRVTVHELELLTVEPPLVRLGVRCSSGTYVRAIARDLGEALGVGAHLNELRRTSVGRFDVADAIRMDALDDDEAVRAARVEPLAALEHLPTVEIEADAVTRLFNGQRISVGQGALRGARPAGADGAPGEAESPVLVTVSRDADLLAIGELEAGVVKPRKVFTA